MSTIDSMVGFLVCTTTQIRCSMWNVSQIEKHSSSSKIKQKLNYNKLNYTIFAIQYNSDNNSTHHRINRIEHFLRMLRSNRQRWASCVICGAQSCESWSAHVDTNMHGIHAVSRTYVIGRRMEFHVNGIFAMILFCTGRIVAV